MHGLKKSIAISTSQLFKITKKEEEKKEDEVGGREQRHKDRNTDIGKENALCLLPPLHLGTGLDDLLTCLPVL